MGVGGSRRGGEKRGLSWARSSGQEFRGGRERHSERGKGMEGDVGAMESRVQKAMSNPIWLLKGTSGGRREAWRLVRRGQGRRGPDLAPQGVASWDPGLVVQTKEDRELWAVRADAKPLLRRSGNL